MLSCLYAHVWQCRGAFDARGEPGASAYKAYLVLSLALSSCLEELHHSSIWNVSEAGPIPWWPADDSGGMIMIKKRFLLVSTSVAMVTYFFGDLIFA